MRLAFTVSHKVITESLFGAQVSLCQLVFMRLTLPLSAVLMFLAPALPASSAEICVENGDEAPFHFVAEARNGARVVANLAPGERLCAAGPSALGGVVSVFENADEAEGCSRLVAAPGGTRILHRYVSFDRCAWDDNI